MDTFVLLCFLCLSSTVVTGTDLKTLHIEVGTFSRQTTNMCKLHEVVQLKEIHLDAKHCGSQLLPRNSSLWSHFYCGCQGGYRCKLNKEFISKYPCWDKTFSIPRYTLLYWCLSTETNGNNVLDMKVNFRQTIESPASTTYHLTLKSYSEILRRQCLLVGDFSRFTLKRDGWSYRLSLLKTTKVRKTSCAPSGPKLTQQSECHLVATNGFTIIIAMAKNGFAWIAVQANHTFTISCGEIEVCTSPGRQTSIIPPTPGPTRRVTSTGHQIMTPEGLKEKDGDEDDHHDDDESSNMTLIVVLCVMSLIAAIAIVVAVALGVFVIRRRQATAGQDEPASTSCFADCIACMTQRKSTEDPAEEMYAYVSIDSPEVQTRPTLPPLQEAATTDDIYTAPFVKDREDGPSQDQATPAVNQASSARADTGNYMEPQVQVVNQTPQPENEYSHLASSKPKQANPANVYDALPPADQN